MVTVVEQVPTLQEWLMSLVQPGIILAASIYYYIQVLIETLLGRVARSELRDEAFSRFWLNFFPEPSDPAAPLAPPSGPSILLPPLFTQASGVVLDIGPGSGLQIPLLAKSAPAIREVWAAEPCTGLHAKLSSKARENGLGEKYNILPCSAEPESLIPTLAKEGLLSGNSDQGIFDTVICCRVLCSVPDQAETVRGLYRLLRPGGKMIVCEHIASPLSKIRGSGSGSGSGNASRNRNFLAQGRTLVASVLQHVYMFLGWSYFVGNCSLLCKTDNVLVKIAEEEEEEEEEERGGKKGWEKVDLKVDFAWSPIPHMSGILVKKE